MADILIRNGTTDEYALVLQSFVLEYQHAPAAKGIHKTFLSSMMSLLLASWTFLVAVEPETDEILGFLVYQAPSSIAWIQTKLPYRKRGVATALISHSGIKPGNIDTPFLPGRTSIADNFPRWLNDRGWRLCFRPWLPWKASS